MDPYNRQVRDWIVPTNRRYPLGELLGALREAFPYGKRKVRPRWRRNGRRVARVECIVKRAPGLAAGHMVLPIRLELLGWPRLAGGHPLLCAADVVMGPL